MFEPQLKTPKYKPMKHNDISPPKFKITKMKVKMHNKKEDKKTVEEILKNVDQSPRELEK